MVCVCQATPPLPFPFPLLFIHPEHYTSDDGSVDDFVWVFEISGSVPPSHLIGGYEGSSSERQPPMYFPRGGGSLKVGIIFLLFFLPLFRLCYGVCWIGVECHRG